MTKIKGWRTVAVNVGIAAGTAGLHALAGVNWIELVGPTWSMLIVAAINIALRAVTTSPIGKKD